MKKLIALSIVLFAAFSSFAQTHVSGYTRSNGTYVAPHYRSSPNYTKADNYSTIGNTNPYTGSAGTKTYSDYNNYESNSASTSYNAPVYSTPTYSTSTYNYGSTHKAPVYKTTISTRY